MSEIPFVAGKRFENLTIPNLITYGGLLFALIGIYLLIKNQIVLAIIFLTLCDVYDTLDGYIARKFKMFSPIGADLDSLVDVIAFVVAPFIIAIQLNSNPLILTAVFFVGCGIYRLARFNAEKKIPGYVKGLQVPIAAHIIYLTILINPPILILSVIYFILGLLMVSTFKSKSRFSTGASLVLMPIIVILAAVQLLSI